MLKAPAHQVAGHFAASGKVGPLIDDSGLFYKPLQSLSRGSTELAFYTSLSDRSSTIPAHILSFFPTFHGSRILNHSGGDVPHIVLEDLTHGLLKPSVIDFKVGARTWGPHDEDWYFSKCLEKDRNSTSVALGFRVSGLKIEKGELGVYIPRKDEVKRFGVADVRRILREFGAGGDGIVMQKLLGQLNQLKCWFEEQTIWHFYSASVLIIYEKGKMVRVKMVDFAHVSDGNGVIDHNFLGGLCSLINFVKEVVEEFYEVSGKKKEPELENGNISE